MGLLSELTEKVDEIFAGAWTAREGKVVPAPADVPLNNTAVHFDDAVVLYADLNGSTKMVETMKWEFSAEIYKTYLYCAARVIRDAGGEITAYDGDRIMGVFLGNSKNSSAAKCALRLNYCVVNIVNPGIRKIYKTSDFYVKHIVGIDRSELRVARTGVRGDNDLVWVGNAANYAAKLTNEDGSWPSIITSRVYDMLNEEAKFTKGELMWTSTYSNEINESVYGSNWTWMPPD